MTYEEMLVILSSLWPTQVKTAYDFGSSILKKLNKKYIRITQKYLDQKLDTIHGGNFKSKLPKATFAKAFFILSIEKI